MRGQRFAQMVIIGFLGLGASAAGYPAEPGAAPDNASYRKAADKHEKQGNQFYAAQRWQAARQEWSWALALDPSRTYLADKLADGQPGSEIKKPEPGAKPTLPVQQQDIPQHRDLNLKQADNYYRESQLKEAELAWKNVLSSEPKNTQAQAGLDKIANEIYQSSPRQPFDEMTKNLYEEGMLAFRQGNYLPALNKLEEAKKLNPNQPQVKNYYRQAQLALQQEQQQAIISEIRAEALKAEAREDGLGAFHAWNKLLKIAPQDQEALQGCARAQAALQPWAAKQLLQAQQALSSRAYAEAETYYQSVLEVFPEHRQARIGLNTCRQKMLDRRTQQNQSAEAQKAFNQGVFAYRRGDLSSAISAWQRAIELAPEEREYSQWLARAQKENAEILNKNQQNAEKYYQDGLKAYQNGNLDQAREHWQTALKFDPRHEKALKNLQQVEQELR